MAPLLHLREQAVNLSLKEAGQRTTAGSARARVRSGAGDGGSRTRGRARRSAPGLLLRSFWNLIKVDAGFNRTRLVTFGLVLPGATYHDPQSVIDFFQRLNGQLAAAARRAGVGGDDRLAAHPTGQRQRYATSRATRRRRKVRSRTSTTTRPSRRLPVQTMGIPLVEGRDFTPPMRPAPGRAGERDAGEGRSFKDQSPIGRRLKPGFSRQIAVVHHRRRRAGRQAGRRRREDRDRGLLPG